MQNISHQSKDIHILIPQIYDYIRFTWTRIIKVKDRMKIAN